MVISLYYIKELKQQQIEIPTSKTFNNVIKELTTPTYSSPLMMVALGEPSNWHIKYDLIVTVLNHPIVAEQLLSQNDLSLVVLVEVSDDSMLEFPLRAYDDGIIRIRKRSGTKGGKNKYQP